MSEQQSRNISMSVPIGVVALAAALVLTGAAYAVANRSDEESTTPQSGGRSGGGLGRKLGLRAAIALIENDVTRRVVVVALKAIARRS